MAGGGREAMSDAELIKNTLEPGFESLNQGSKSKRGGARKGAGGPKGRISKKRLEVLRVKEAFNQRVMKHADKLLNAQLHLAVGEQSLYIKYYTGKGKDRKQHIEVVTDDETIKQYLDDDGYTLNQDSDGEYYYLSKKPANNMALDSLFNRSFGKATEKIEIDGDLFKEANLTIRVVKDDNLNLEQEAADSKGASE